MNTSCGLFNDAGFILITTISDLDDFDLEVIETLNRPGDLLVVNVGPSRLSNRGADLQLDSVDDLDDAVQRVQNLLREKDYLPQAEYFL